MNTTLTNHPRTSLERWWNNYQGPRDVCPWGLPTRAHPTAHPRQVQAAGAGPRLGQVVGLRLGRAVGSWRWPCCGCSTTGAGTDGSGRLGRSSQSWWCPLTINTPHPIFRNPQSFVHVPCTQTIISLSHFQSIPIQTKKLPLNKRQDILTCFTLVFFASPLYQTHEVSELLIQGRSVGSALLMWQEKPAASTKKQDVL